MKLEKYCKKNLQEGMIIKDYKNLCKILHEPELRGKKKEEQLKIFSQYFTYTNIGRKFKIIHINENMNNEKNESRKYTIRVQNILLSYLSMNNKEIVYITKNELILLLGLVNKFYIETYNNREQLLTLDEEMTYFPINNFFERSEHKNRDIISYAIKSIESKNLAHIENTYLIYTKNSCDIREATETEIKYILDIKYKLLKEFNVENEHVLFIQKRNTNFYERMNEIIKEEKGWLIVIKVYKFIYNHNNILEKINVNESIKEVNQLVHDALDKQAEKNYETNPKCTERKILKNKEFGYYENYPRLEKILSNHLITLPEIKEDKIKQEE